MVLHPRHRGDCADFFTTPQQIGRVELIGPTDVISEIEHIAQHAGRTWNDQLNYIAELFLGHRLPDFDDTRSVEDWCALMSAFKYRSGDAGYWTPFTCLLRKKP